MSRDEYTRPQIDLLNALYEHKSNGRTMVSFESYFQRGCDEQRWSPGDIVILEWNELINVPTNIHNLSLTERGVAYIFRQD